MAMGTRSSPGKATRATATRATSNSKKATKSTSKKAAIAETPSTFENPPNLVPRHRNHVNILRDIAGAKKKKSVPQMMEMYYVESKSIPMKYLVWDRQMTSRSISASHARNQWKSLEKEGCWIKDKPCVVVKGRGVYYINDGGHRYFGVKQYGRHKHDTECVCLSV